jgi:uncharacterized protein YbjT (DUF2867 family)
VLGVCGNVGSNVVKAMATKYPSIKCVAATRNTESDKAKDLVSKYGSNVKLVRANMADPSSMDSAIPKNCDAVFINTPGDANRTQLAINAIDACKRAGVKHCCVVSVAAADYKGVFASQFKPIEQHLKSSGLNYTILRLPMFLENNFSNQKTVKEEGKIYGPARPDAAYAPVAICDICEAAAAILANPSAHRNKTYQLTSKTMTQTDLAKAFSNALGKKVEYVQVPYESAKQSFLSMGFPEWQTNGMLELWQGVDSGASFNKETSDVKNITGHEPTTCAQWTQQAAPVFTS